MTALSTDPGLRDGPRPILGRRRSLAQQVILGVFVLLPTVALAAAITFVWGWGLSWIDVALGVGFYVLSGLGVTAGFHADPTCARHGVRPGQPDITARLIWAFERLGWASDVRWPTRRRLDRLTADR